MRKNDKSGTEEVNFTLNSVPYSPKDGRKKSEMFQETPVKCGNGSEASRLERSTHLLNDLKNHGNWILISSNKKTFIIDPVFSKPNYRKVVSENNVSEHRWVLTTKHPASIMMLGVVASNGVLLEQGYKLNFCRLQIKNYWRRKFLKTRDYVFKQDEAPAHTQSLCKNGWTPKWAFGSKTFCLPQSADLNPFRSTRVPTSIRA